MRKFTWMLLLSGTALAGPALPFKNVTLAGPGPEQVHLTVDLDGDHKRDDVYLVRVNGPIPGEVKQVYPQSWAKGDGKPPAKGEMALAVVLHPGGKQSPYLLRLGADYFNSPTWKQGHYRTMVGSGHGPQPPKNARGTSISLFTESGAKTYIYWNGKAFLGSSEGDEP